MQNPSLPLDDLLEHAAWVRGLARSLVQDAARADDVAQEVWLAALRAGPRDDRNLRGWLRTTARRVAALGLRREREGALREAAAARREALPATDELVERAALQREVAREVLALDEPHRRVLLLRYWEGLPPREIAARERLPVATVKTRLQRAQARLRSRLEAQHGGQGAWCLALAPLLADRGGAAVWPAGALGPSPLVLGALAVGGAALVVAVALVASRPDESTREGALVATRSPEGASGAASSSPGAAAGHPVEAAEGSSRRAARVTAGAAPPAGARLVDVQGRALEGLRLREPGPHAVRWQGGDPIWIGNDVRTLRLSLEQQERLRRDRAALGELIEAQAHPEEWSATLLGTAIPARELVSGPGGALELERARDAEVVEPGWTLVASGEDAGRGELLVVAAPAVRLAGRVVDLAGDPVQRAEVRFLAPQLELSSEGLLRHGGPPPCRTDEQGRFVLRGVPSLEAARIEVTSDDHEPWSGAVPRRDDEDLLVRLAPRAASTPRIVGLVTDGLGAPVADARVHLGELHAEVDVDGSYTLRVPEPAPEARLVVWAPGRAPFVDDDAGRALGERPDGRLVRDAILEERSGALSGRVLDASGRPVVGARVGLFEPTPLDGTLASLEARIDGRSLTLPTDAEGRFRLGGLLGERVRLRVFDAAGRRVHVSDELWVGIQEQDIVLPVGTGLRAVAGHVRWSAGLEPRHIVVVAGFDWIRTRDGQGAVFETGARVEAGPDGAFALPDVPERHAWIEVRLDDTRRRFDVEALDLERPLTLLVE